MLLIFGIINAMAVKKEYAWEAFLDTYRMDQFSYAHKYYKRGKR